MSTKAHQLPTLAATNSFNKDEVRILLELGRAEMRRSGSVVSKHKSFASVLRKALHMEQRLKDLAEKRDAMQAGREA